MGGRAVSLTCVLEPYGLCLLHDVLNDEVRRCAQVDMLLAATYKLTCGLAALLRVRRLPV